MPHAQYGAVVILVNGQLRDVASERRALLAVRRPCKAKRRSRVPHRTVPPLRPVIFPGPVGGCDESRLARRSRQRVLDVSEMSGSPLLPSLVRPRLPV
jgi:hypothetical protein